MYLDVKINNVPVQLEVKNVGPASLEDIDEFREKLRSGDLVLIDQSTLKPVEAPEKPNPYIETPEPIETPIEPPTSIVEPPKEVVEPKEDEKEFDLSETVEDVFGDKIPDIVPELIDKMEDIFEHNKEENDKDNEATGEHKPWWKSKTIISNVLAAVGCVLGTLVSDNPEMSMYLPASILAVINLGLRTMTTGKVKLPLADQVKKFRNK
jgi:hypothetical protein